MRMQDPQFASSETNKRDASRKSLDSYDAPLPVMEYLHKRSLDEMRATLSMYKKSRARQGSSEATGETLSAYDRPLEVFAYMAKVQRRQIAAAVELFKSRRHNVVGSKIEHTSAS